MYNSVEISNNIEKMLSSMRISARQFEMNAGLPRGTLGNMKKGSMPSGDKLATIALYLHISLDSLIGIDEDLSQFKCADSALLGLKPVTAPRDVVSTIIDQQLSEEEMDDVLEFIEFLKYKRSKKKK